MIFVFILLFVLLLIDMKQLGGVSGRRWLRHTGGTMLHWRSSNHRGDNEVSDTNISATLSAATTTAERCTLCVMRATSIQLLSHAQLPTSAGGTCSCRATRLAVDAAAKIKARDRKCVHVRGPTAAHILCTLLLLIFVCPPTKRCTLHLLVFLSPPSWTYTLYRVGCRVPTHVALCMWWLSSACLYRQARDGILHSFFCLLSSRLDTPQGESEFSRNVVTA